MQYENNILLAGMGLSGRAAARYLDAAGVEYGMCDDGDNEYMSCAESLASFRGYVVKSPGIPNRMTAEHSGARQIINDIELFFRLCLKPTILVTGTNGKSTVVAMVEHILGSCGINARACGNNGIPVLDAYVDGADVYIVELSSYQIEDVSTFSSLAAVVLNIGADHLDRYRDINDYQLVKEKIYQGADCRIFPVGVNGQYLFSDNISGYKSVGQKESVTYFAKDKSIFRDEKIYCRQEDVQLLGTHNYLNICAALCLCDQFNLRQADILSAISSFSGLEHRLEVLGCDSRNRLWINDSKSTNVHSARAAVSAFDKDVCLIMGGRGKGEDYYGLFSEFGGILKHLILFGEDAKLIASQAGNIESKIVVNVTQAVSLAGRIAEDSSVILFSPACASFDQYRDFHHRGEDFKRCVYEEVLC